MRVTLNVLYREAIYLLKNKGFETISECNENVSIIWFFDTSDMFSSRLVIEELNNSYRFILLTSEKRIEKIFKCNYLANLRMFIRKEV